MINLRNLKKIGFGFGYGGALPEDAKYTKQHKQALKFFAYSLKGNLIDTANSYGRGASERIIGKLSSKIKKKNFISSKVDQEKLKFNDFINSVKNSLDNLQIKTLDLIQPHWPNYDVKNDEIISAFKFLKKRKMVRYFGLSNYDLKEIKYFKKKLKNSFKFIQEEFSLRDREINDKISFCEKNNIKILCYSPLGEGNIRFLKKEKKLLSEIAKKYKISKYQVILNYLSTKSKNIILIPHTKNINHLKDNLNSLDFKLSREDMYKIDQFFKPKYLKIRLRDVNYLDKKYKKIKSLDDAIKNKGKLSPSPKEIAMKLKNGYKFKSIKLKLMNKKYYIKQGRLRYWAHVLAFGWNKKIKMMLV